MHLLEAHDALGQTLFYLGEYGAAWRHFAQGIPLIDPIVQRAQAIRHGIAPGVACLAYAAPTLWSLGYPEQALQRCQEALTLAQEFEQQFAPQFRLLYRTELHFMRLVCQPSKQETGEQAVQITFVGQDYFRLWECDHNACSLAQRVGG